MRGKKPNVLNVHRLEFSNITPVFLLIRFAMREGRSCIGCAGIRQFRHYLSPQTGPGAGRLVASPLLGRSLRAVEKLTQPAARLGGYSHSPVFLFLFSLFLFLDLLFKALNTT